jgi:predicted dehydrogenase
MSEHRIGIIMNGVTGRMGANQHLARSIMAICNQGGVPLDNGDVVMPEPLLVGRNEEKLSALAGEHGGLEYTTDLDAALANPAYAVYFDAVATTLRHGNVMRAIEAGKHIYCEKPVAETSTQAYELYLHARPNVKHGVVQDKLWLPGLIKLKQLVDEGFFGRILSVRGEFGYWVFTGEDQPAQRPSWNYRKADGGGIVLDMFAHWRYVIDNLFGEVTSVCCDMETHIPKRWDESGAPYEADADDAAYAMFRTDHDVICQFNSSWCTRVRRDDLLTIHVDGTGGSAVAGLRRCWTQDAKSTPRPVWNPDIDNPIDFYDSWDEFLPDAEFDNAFKAQWELFLRHVAADEPFPWGLDAGAKGVQLAELGRISHECRAWVDVPNMAP